MSLLVQTTVEFSIHQIILCIRIITSCSRHVGPDDVSCIGAGDILSLVEKAESNIKEGEAEAMTKRLLEAKFDFNDFLSQYKMLNNMGSMGSIMKMLPGTPIAFGRASEASDSR